MTELEAEAKAEGPSALEELDTFREYFRLAREMTEARKAKGWSQEKLATKTGLHQSEISDIERGRANPTFQTLQKLARSLDGRIGFLAAGGTKVTAKRSRQATVSASARKHHRAAAHRS
ncbi:MAG: helix-turn-helix transcriptional regulator [Gaiellales bacterium]